MPVNIFGQNTDDNAPPPPQQVQPGVGIKSGGFTPPPPPGGAPGGNMGPPPPQPAGFPPTMTPPPPAGFPPTPQPQPQPQIGLSPQDPTRTPPPQPQQPMGLSVTPPTPMVPKPGPDWVPTQDGKGWVPPGSPSAWQATPQTPQTPPPTVGQPPTLTPPPMAADPAAAAPPPAAAAPPATQDDAFHQQLMKLMSSDPNDVSHDYGLQNQINAYNGQAQLARRQRQEADAEHLAAQGMGQSGVQDTAIDQSYEDMGRDTANYAANATQQEIQSQRDQWFKALGLGGDQLNNERGDATQRYGIDSQTSLGQGDLALRRYLGDSQSNLGLMQLLMQNGQFNDRLGFDMGNAEAGYNRDALMAMMGGG